MITRFHGLALVEAGPEHLAAVTRNLRPEDRREAEAIETRVRGGLSVEERLADGFARSRPRFVLVRERGGKILALGGVVPFGAESPPWGSPWMVGTPALDAVPGAAPRALRAAFRLVRNRFAGLANLISEESRSSLRLVERLGFGSVPVSFPQADQGAPGGAVRLFYCNLNKGDHHVHGI